MGLWNSSYLKAKQHKEDRKAQIVTHYAWAHDLPFGKHFYTQFIGSKPYWKQWGLFLNKGRDQSAKSTFKRASPK